MRPTKRRRLRLASSPNLNADVGPRIVMKEVLERTDTPEMLKAVQDYVSEAKLTFSSLADAIARDIPWYAKGWCAVLLGRTAGERDDLLAILGSALSHAEPYVRECAIGALAQSSSTRALPQLVAIAEDQGQKGKVRNAAMKAVRKLKEDANQASHGTALSRRP